jgi:hypothetical protein
MTANECVKLAEAAGDHYQRVINAFIDEFRRSDAHARRAMLADPVLRSGRLEGLVAAVSSALCREVDLQPPPWVAETHSPEPFFAFPARSYALRVRLMFESPAPFRIRNVFVPDNYLSRA